MQHNGGDHSLWLLTQMGCPTISFIRPIQKNKRTENVNLWIPFMHFPHGGTYGETKGSDRCRLKIIDQEKMFKVHHNT